MAIETTEAIKAREAIEAKEEIPPIPSAQPHFFSIGFFGVPNIGDELLSVAVSRGLERIRPGSVLSLACNDGSVSSSYSGISAEKIEGFAPTPEFVAGIRARARALSDSDLVVIGGGGLIADRYSSNSLIRFCVDAAWTTARGGRFVLVGVGALEIRRARLRPIARFLCSTASAVACRDESSASRIRRYGSRDDVIVSPDLAHMVMSELLTGEAPENYAIVNIREVPPIANKEVEKICRDLCEEVERVVLLAAEPTEIEFLGEFISKWPNEIRSRVEIVEPDTLIDAIRLVEKARVVIAERFHVNLIAAHAGRPLVALLYEEKVKDLVSALGEGYLEAELDEIPPDMTAAAFRLAEPAWNSLLSGTAHASRMGFDAVIQAGLAAPGPTAKQRLIGALIAMGIVSFALVRTPLIYTKRVLLGRGPLNGERIRRRFRDFILGRNDP